jgi:ring-1,2-phenylacetyl-CoA epoxidase subunit PaaA
VSSTPENPDPALEAAEAAMMTRTEAGELFESLEALTPGYRSALEQTLDIAATGEVTVLTWAYTAFDKCPDIGAKLAVCATIQDEVGHAHQQGLLAERVGVSVHERTFHDDVRHIFTWPIMEIPVRSYIEFVVSQCFLDRAGLHWTKDIELNCSFAPYRRVLKKVNFEEVFHMHHGAYWTEFYWNHSEETRAAVQKATDWIFPHGVMWFGKPDNLKTRPDQLRYKIRGWTNDYMRDRWLQSAAAYAKKLGLRVPARFDEDEDKYVLDMPYPMLFDAENYSWTWEKTTQAEYWKNARKGGPLRPAAYERLRREEWGSQLW